MSTTAPAPTNIPCVGLTAADVFPAEASRLTADQTLIARVGGDNGRYMRIVRDDALGVLTAVTGIDTVTPARFHMDRVLIASMLSEFPGADRAGALDDHEASLIERMAERLAVAGGVRWDKVPEPTGHEIVDRDTRGYWRTLARAALGL